MYNTRMGKPTITDVSGLLLRPEQLVSIAKTPVALPLEHLGSGKVREMFRAGDNLLMIVTTDRVSAFDVVLPQGIPLKGRILNEISLHNFESVADIVPNHVVTGNLASISCDFPQWNDYAHLLNRRTSIVRMVEPIKFEFIVRGYLYGSAYEEYSDAGRNRVVCGIELPEGLEKASKLPEPIFTPSTKAPKGEHDVNVTFGDVESALGNFLASQIKEVSVAIYKRLSEKFDGREMILADLKLEFGLIDGKLVLIDELATPDSCRIWKKAEYVPGRDQESSNDKQYLRDLLTWKYSWDKKGPPPRLSEEEITNASMRYVDAYTLLTGQQPRIVSIVMGSPSDMAVAKEAIAVLEPLGIWYHAQVQSAHRTARSLEEYVAKTINDPTIALHISCAGMSAVQPGFISALTTKPVIGVPVSGRLSLDGGMDALYAMVGIPPGAGPVLTVGLNNGTNGGIAAAQLLAMNDHALTRKLLTGIRREE